MEQTKDINRIKVVLAEKKRTNASQPSLETLQKIAELLGVNYYTELVRAESLNKND